MPKGSPKGPRSVHTGLPGPQPGALETLDEPPRVAGPRCPFPGTSSPPGMPRWFPYLPQEICDHSRAAGGGEPASAHTCPGGAKKSLNPPPNPLTTPRQQPLSGTEPAPPTAPKSQGQSKGKPARPKHPSFLSLGTLRPGGSEGGTGAGTAGKGRQEGVGITSGWCCIATGAPARTRRRRVPGFVLQNIPELAQGQEKTPETPLCSWDPVRQQDSGPGGCRGEGGAGRLRARPPAPAASPTACSPGVFGFPSGIPS